MAKKLMKDKFFVNRQVFLKQNFSPGAYIFQRPFSGAYFWRGLYSEGGNLPFFFVFLSIWGQFSKYKPPGGLYLEGRFNRGFFTFRVLGAYTWRGLFSEFYGILIG